MNQDRHNEPKRENPDEIRPDDRVDTVMRFFQAAKNAKHRKDAEKWWDTADALMDGDHWKGISLANWRAKIVSNKVYRTVDKFMAFMMATRAEIEILPRHPDDVDTAEQIDSFVQYLWDMQNWTGTIGMVYEKQILRHIGFIKCYFDIHEAEGRGLPKIEPISVRDLFLHPDAILRDGELKSKVTIHLMRMTREEIITKYEVDIDIDDRKPQEQAKQKNISPFRNPTSKVTEGSAAQQEGSVLSKKDKPEVGGAVDVLEAWIYDEQRIETPELDNPSKGIAPLQYPNGRVIVVAKDKVLLDQPNPLNFFPFVPITGSPDAERVYRPSIVNQIANPQYEINKRRSQIADHAALSSNPIKLIDPRSGIHQDEIDNVTNEPGQSHIDLTGGNGITFLVPPSLSKEVIEGVQLADDDIDDISGIHEAARGETPTNVKSGVAIEALQSESRGRVDLKSLFSEMGLKVVVRNVISMILDFISDERIFRVIGPSGETGFQQIDPVQLVLPRRQNRIAELESQKQQLLGQLPPPLASPESLDASNEPIASPEIVQIIEQRIGNIDQQIQATQIMPASNLIGFDIKISVGTRALSARAKSNMALLLHQEPSSTGVGTVLDDIGLLTALEYPGWQKVWKRKQEEIERQMEMQRLLTLREFAQAGLQPPADIANPQQGGNDIEMVAAALKLKGLEDEDIGDVIDILQQESAIQQNGTGFSEG